MSLLNTILGITPANAIEHARLLVIFSVVWFGLAFVMGKQRGTIKVSIYLGSSLLFFLLGTYCFSVAYENLMFFGRIRVLLEIFSALMVILIISLLEYARYKLK